MDVFTDTPLAGNPLAVVADCEFLDDATMKRIAREFNQSETTFVLPSIREEATGGLGASLRPGLRRSALDTMLWEPGGGSRMRAA